MKRFNSLFPLWVILLSLIAFYNPTPFTAGKEFIVLLLSAIMFFMGLTLSARDFKQVLIMPAPIVIGIGLQFLIMPLAAFLISKFLSLPQELVAGLIVVGSCAGGTASNVIAFLAKANVALSITLTLCSTLLGIVFTPLLCWLYIDAAVQVDYLAMFLSIVKMVLLPALSGVIINYFCTTSLRKIDDVLAGLAVMAIVIIIAIIVSLNIDKLSQVGALILLAVVLHNCFGFVAGYLLSKKLKLSENDCRTIAIEVGMQNSGLGVALAIKYFSPLAALPGALFSIWHNVSGSIIAGYWANQRNVERKRKE